MAKMTGDEIKALRSTLDCTARDLGTALGVDQATVLAWEREELFPTKRHVEAMRALLEKGPGAVPASRAKAQSPFEALADPAVWRLFRKILAHAELRRGVEKLASSYDDPNEA
jgi:transcriptional regulator with XRE-family HTH domain